MSVDCIYVAASAHDSRFTRICVASIRYFYPDAPIRLLVGGPLQPGLAEELRRLWDVGVADLAAGDYGWGYVKLEALFGPPGERFLVLDSDTVITGPVLEAWADGDGAFLVDDEAQSEADAKRLYYDWEAIRALDEAALPPQFVFNSGQWFGTAGVLRREDFAPWVEWAMPPRLRHPHHFMPGDQGVLNYVLNRKAREGLPVSRRKIMRWPGHGMPGLDAAAVAARRAPALVVHWAGMKRARQQEMVGADLLAFFERFYYARLPGGELRRAIDGARHALAQWARDLQVRLRLAARRLSRSPAATS